ncbi:Copper-sensing transcriptional repressor RicR [subsurface metagenome]
MMTNEHKRKVINRLNRIEGQIRGIVRMIHEDRYCIEILTQTRAVVAAIHKAEDNIFHNHLKTCVSETFNDGKPENQKGKITEIMCMIFSFRANG